MACADTGPGVMAEKRSAQRNEQSMRTGQRWERRQSMARMSWAGSWGRLAVALAVLAAVLATPGRSYAEHGDYVLGTLGLLGAVQAPEGIYYQNIFSYYTANGEGNFEVP